MYSKGELLNAPPKCLRARICTATSTRNTQEASQVGTPINSGHLLERFHCTHTVVCAYVICGYYLRAEFILLGAPDCANTLQRW